MGELVAALAVVLVLAALAGGAALWVDRARRERSRQEKSAVRSSLWEVGEQGARSSLGGGVTQVFVRRVTALGDEVDRIEVASVPNGAADWRDRVLEARMAAAERAALLNAQP